jgi:hypothetical protein
VPKTDVRTAQDEAEVVVDQTVAETRLRGETSSAGTYREPGDLEGLTEDTGRSSVR